MRARKSKISRRQVSRSTAAKVRTQAFAKKLGIKKVREARPNSTLMSIRKLPDSKTHVDRHEVVSASSGNLYTVSRRRASGREACNCMSFVTRGYCKHTKAVFGKETL